MKNNTKQLLLINVLAFLLCNVNIAQSNSASIIVNEESKTALFSQSDARIFPDSNKGFVVSWIDSRYGDSKYFAQKYNSDLSKIGTNYETFSNSLILYSTTGKSFSIYDSSYSYYYFPWDERGGKIFNGIIHDDFSASRTIDVGGGEYPFCGTGWPGEGYSAVKSEDNFICATDFGGKYQLTKIFPDGTDSLINQNDENYYSTILNTSIAINKNGEYAFAYLKDSILGFDDSIDSSGVYVELYLKTDILIAKVNIKRQPDFSYDRPFASILATSIDDSLFQIFVCDTLTLTSFIINKFGIIKETNSFKLTGLYGYNFWWGDRETFTISNYNGNKRALIVKYSDYGNLYKNLFYLDKDGEIIGEPIVDSTSNFQYSNEIFLDENEHLIFTKTVDKDVYLYKCNNFDVIDSVKINDDISGSNEVRPYVKKGENNGFYIYWVNEESSVGQLVNSNGNLEGENKILQNESFSFFNDGSSLVPWSKTLASGMKQMGFTIIDKDSNIVASIPLTVESGSQIIRLNLQIINDSEFIAGYFSNGKNYLAKYSKGGTRNAYAEISGDSSYSAAKILLDDDYFYFNIGTNLYKYDYYLNLLKEMKEFPYFANYIGKSRFLWYGYDPDNYNKYLGTIYDENGEIINEKFELGVESKFKIEFAKSGQFIVFAEVGNKLVANTYNRDGQKLISDFVVHELNNEKVRDLNFYVNKNKILFAWSGRKLDEGNYDIYAITYNLDLVTGIKESISPAKYSFKLEQNYPNPFNPSTTIKYSIPSMQTPLLRGVGGVLTTLKIYDILGREVATLVNNEQKPGNYEIQFDASNLTSGIYFYRLQSGRFVESRKMILIK